MLKEIWKLGKESECLRYVLYIYKNRTRVYVKTRQNQTDGQMKWKIGFSETFFQVFTNIYLGI